MFVIEERRGDTEWITVWKLTGKQKLDAIPYGANHKDLIEVEPPKPLSQAATYRATAIDRSENPPAGVTTFFAFDENGNVITSGWPL